MSTTTRPPSPLTRRILRKVVTCATLFLLETGLSMAKSAGAGGPLVWVGVQAREVVQGGVLVGDLPGWTCFFSGGCPGVGRAEVCWACG